MQPFSYVRSDDPPGAVKQVAGTSRAKYVAGGTTLLDLMKLDVETPVQLVDINPMPLASIETTASGLRIGAMVRNSDLAYHEAVRTKYPVLSQALLSGATAQIRNMATVGGNLLQRTRCTYFRDTAWPCNKRELGTGCSAIHGYNRGHAILGTSDKCIATHPSDMCVALAALEAVIVTEGSAGERRIPFEDFYVPYGDDPSRETILQPGELISAVELPTADFFVHSHYLKIRDRASFEFALVSVAAALDIQNGTIRAARLAMGGVGTKPWRMKDAEKSLVGVQADDQAFAAAADVALHGAKPQSGNAFKIALAKRAIVRALTTLAEGG